MPSIRAEPDAMLTSSVCIENASFPGRARNLPADGAFNQENGGRLKNGKVI
jgi:hypothetical protein